MHELSSGTLRALTTRGLGGAEVARADVNIEFGHLYAFPPGSERWPRQLLPWTATCSRPT